MNLSVDVWSDFVCPFCYLNASTLIKLQKKYPLHINWRAYELYPNSPLSITDSTRHVIEAMRPKLRDMAYDQFGLEINPGPFGISSRLALLASKVAQAFGVKSEFHFAVFRAYWEQARSIDQRPVLLEIAQEVGLDPETFDEALTKPDFEVAVAADLNQAFLNGLSSVPSMLVNDSLWIRGTYPYDALEEKLLEATAHQTA